ncbi:MAG: DUF2934 domain-containing protein [Rhodospirillales bacterium]
MDITALVKDIQDRVREVAYLMWESAGRQHGMAMEYWLSAEREVITTMQSAAERMMPGQAQGAGEAMADAAPVSEAGEAVMAAGEEAAKAIPAPEAAPAVAGGEAEPVSQASEVVVEATSATADAAAAAGAPAAKAAARPTRKAAPRTKRTQPPAS